MNPRISVNQQSSLACSSIGTLLDCLSNMVISTSRTLPNAAIPPSLSNLASPKNASMSISAMACAPYGLSSWSRRATLCGIWARPAPVPIGPPIWLTLSTNCLQCSATIGWSITSIRIGAWTCVAWLLRGVSCHLLPRPWSAYRTTRLPERSDPYACLSLYAQTWLLAESSGAVV